MVDPRMIQIPFGPGLDKELGAMVVRPGSMLDLRNVYHHEGSLAARQGMEKKIQFTDFRTGLDATHILAGIAIRSERVGIVVSFYEPTREVTIHRVDGAADYGTPLGNWLYDLLPGGPSGNPVWEWPGTDPPKVVLEEIFGQVYFAHDERYIGSRAVTWVYDPYFLYSDAGGLAPLKVFFDEDHRYSGEKVHELPVLSITVEKEQGEWVRFRGVSRHMDYLFGWGYGNRLENRPEMVRVSYPGEPRRWHPEHYFIAGDRRDPVISCEPARQTLICFKETETYQIFGYSRATFGIRPYDHLYGCLAGRLSRTVSGEVFFWSAEGPRRGGDRGPSQKIHLPLDLGGFEPATLVARTDFVDGWCDYIDEVELLYFGFGRRLYVLSLRNPADPRWTYWELARKAYCGFRLYGESGGAPPDGFPDNLTIQNNTVPSCTLPSVRVQWDNNNQFEDENYIDIWVKPNSQWWTDTNLLPYEFDGAASPAGWTKDVTGVVGGTASSGGGDDNGEPIYFWSVSGSTAVDDEAVLYQVITGADVVVGNEYRFEVLASAYYDYVKTLTHGSFLRMEFLDSGDSVLGAAIERVFNQGAWEPIYVEGTAPATTTKIRVSICASTAAGGTCRVQFKRPELLMKEDIAWRKMDLGRPAPVITGEATQSVTISDLRHPGMEYQFAARYTNLAGTPGPGYEGTPDTWPSGSLDTHTLAINAPFPYTRRDGEADPDTFGPPFWVSYAACDTSFFTGGRGPYKLPVEVEFGGVTGFAYLSERFNTQRLMFYDPEDFPGGASKVVRMRYLGADANSAWSVPVGMVPALNEGGNPPTVVITSPPGGKISMNWDWGTAAAPSGHLRALEVWVDYDGAGAPGDYRRIYGSCGEKLWGESAEYICLGLPPSDPYVVSLTGSYSGVTITVKVREVYVPASWGWNAFGISYSYGVWSEEDSVAATP